MPNPLQTPKKHAEFMIPTPLPERPWQKVATDLFYHSGKTYIIVVDYYSRFFEIAPLKSTTTENAINHLKGFFLRHGIPERAVKRDCKRLDYKVRRSVVGITFIHIYPTGEWLHPAELVMGRKLRSTLPLAPEKLTSQTA